MSNRRIIRSQNTVLSAAFVLSIASAANAILGLLKSRLLTRFFGVSPELTVFYTADRIPSSIYSVLVVGTISTIFIPTFSSILKKDQERAYKVAGAIIQSVLVIFLGLGILVYLLAPLIIRLLAVGEFSLEEISLGVTLMRLMLISQLFLIIGSILTSVLQTYKYFIIPALAPLLYNSGMILGTLLLSSKFGIKGPTYGLILGSLLHVCIQLPFIKSTEFKFKPNINFKDRSIRKALKLAPPRIIQTTLNSVIHTTINSLAILISKSSVVFLKYAMQLQFFPVHIFGLSMSAALLPTLSNLTDEKSNDKFKESLTTSIHQMLFLVMPISAILFVLRIPVVRIVYGVAQFPWEATITTAYTLACYSISIFSQSTTYMLTRAFFARKDTTTPVKVTLLTGLINIIASILYVYGFKGQIWGIALIYSITSYMDTILLSYLLKKKVGNFGIENTVIPFIKISYATFLMAITLYAGLKLLDIRFLDTTKTINLLFLTVITTTVGMITYLGFTKLLKVEEIELLYKLMKKLKLERILKGKTPHKIDQQVIN